MKLKSIISSFLFLSTLWIGLAQEQNYHLSSHILDISKGQPASDVTIKLEKLKSSGDWEFIAENETDKDGRVKNFLPIGTKNNIGIFKLTYFIKPYFENLELDSFYPFIEVVFEIKDDQHYHVPITLSPFGYSTYRGN